MRLLAWRRLAMLISALKAPWASKQVLRKCEAEPPKSLLLQAWQFLVAQCLSAVAKLPLLLQRLMIAQKVLALPCPQALWLLATAVLWPCLAAPRPAATAALSMCRWALARAVLAALCL